MATTYIVFRMGMIGIIRQKLIRGCMASGILAIYR